MNYPVLFRSLTLATWRAGLPVSPTGLAETSTAFEDSPQRSQSPQAFDSARPVPISSTGQLRRDGDCTRLFSRLNAGRGVAPVIRSDMSGCEIKLPARIPSLLAPFARSLRKGALRLLKGKYSYILNGRSRTEIMCLPPFPVDKRSFRSR